MGKGNVGVREERVMKGKKNVICPIMNAKFDWNLDIVGSSEQHR